MNKSLKKIIAVTLTMSAFSAIAPTTNLNVITTKAYADSSDGVVTSLKVKTSGGSTIRTYSNDDYKSEHKVEDNEVEIGKTYYVKTSSKKIKISTSGPDSDCVRVFKSTSSSSKGTRTNDSISLSSGTNTIIVRVYNENPGAIKYSDKTYAFSEYKFKIKYTGSSGDEDDDDKQDNVYLKSIYLSDGSISFLKNTSTYNVNVDESVKAVQIAAKPDCDRDEYDDYKVKIDGTTVDEDDKFKKEVSLSKGKNEIKITVKDDDNERTYTLNINRGSTSSSNTTTSTLTNETNIKTNQWVQANGVWKYNDAIGNTVKNSWVQNYYVQADGNMATGWTSINGSWYYFGTDGAKKTGWQSIGESWYYLDSQGVMQTGWMKDFDGRYYYLNSNGSMAYNTTIGGYKLGANGAWRK